MSARILDEVLARPEFAVIKEAYRGKIAHRSGLPYMNHIFEGVLIIAQIDPRDQAPVMEFCLHPIFQSDDAIVSIDTDREPFSSLTRRQFLYCMEYRKTANAYSINHPVREPKSIGLSPLKDVNTMLIADKVQNKKDFTRHIEHANERTGFKKAAAKTRQYFDSWLAALGVDDAAYERLVSHLDKQRPIIDEYVNRIYRL